MVACSTDSVPDRRGDDPTSRAAHDSHPPRVLPAGDSAPEAGGEDDEAEGEDEEVRPRRAPWHFKLLLVGTVIYLGWRLYQGIEWLVHHV